MATLEGAHLGTSPPPKNFSPLPMKSSRSARFALSLPMACCFAYLGFSQAVPPAAPGAAAPEVNPADAVVLSPFVVTTGSDVGYAATSTLSGSRLNTPLNDVSAQVQVFTEELLRDIAATNMEQALLYSANTDTYYNSYTVDTDLPGLGDGTNNRGLGELTNLRGLFPSSVQADNYNTERATLSSGPNAILFGLGNAGGSYDTSLKRAGFRRKHEAMLRFDSFGSTRYSLDINQPLIANKLAARVVGLDDHTGFFRKPSFDDNKRLFSTVTFMPTKSTTIRVAGEWVKRDASRPSLALPRDSITAWLDNGAPTYANNRINANTRVLTVATIPANQADYLLPLSGNFSRYVINTGNTSLPGLFTHGSDVDTLGPNAAAGVNSNDTFIRSLDRETLVPYREINTFGTANIAAQRARTLNFNLEHRLAENLSLEIAAVNERSRQVAGPFQGTSRNTTQVPVAEISADANQFVYVRDPVTGQNTFIPNPNLGRLYVTQRVSSIISEQEYSEIRATLAYQLDLAKRPGFLRHLGRHRLAGVGSLSVNDRISQNDSGYVDGPSDTTLRPNFPGGQRHNRNQPVVRYYLDRPSDAGTQGLYYWGDTSAIYDPTKISTFKDPVNGRDLTIYPAFQVPYGAFNIANGTRQRVSSQVLALQSYLLQDRLIAFYGLRRDEVKLSDAIPKYPERINPNSANPERLNVAPGGSPNATEDFNEYYYNYKFTNDYKTTRSAQKSNWGLVARPLGRLFQAHYSQSENFKVDTVGRLDPYGASIPTGIGEGRDYGVTVFLPNNALSVRVNFFKNTQYNNPAPTEINRAKTALYNIENYLQDFDSTIKPSGIAPNVFPQGQYVITSDYISRGAEVQVTANFGNWRFFVTGGRQRAEDTNIADNWAKWSDARIAELWANGNVSSGGAFPGWDRVVMGNDFGGLPGLNATGLGAADNRRTLREYYTVNWSVPYQVIKARNGSLRSGQREYRLNMIASYAFKEGILRGATLGGGGRWASENTIGYYLNGEGNLDLDRPIKGAVDFAVDAFAGYRWTNARWLGRGRSVRFQVNVRNLLDRDTLVNARAVSDGSAGQLAMVQPRQFIFTSTFEF